MVKEFDGEVKLMIPGISYVVKAEDKDLTIAEIILKRLQISHSLLVKLKQQQKITVNGNQVFTNYLVKPGEIVQIDLNLIEENQISAENIPLDIVYSDDDFLVINKPAGMPVHPSRRHQSATLANAVAYYWQQQNKHLLFRPISRLDKDTSGLILIGQNQFAHQGLAKQLSQKQVLRAYVALVEGNIKTEAGTINFPIGRKEGSSIERTVLLDSNSDRGQTAVTHYRVLQQFKGYTLLALQLETGRTHQIRVHLSYLGHPLCGDTLYGGSSTLIGRQALHADKLSFLHPRFKQKLNFSIPLPTDMIKAINLLG
ncbi:RluA family pseudouridine synthase [Bacillota bacterium LX-D]|nr:RluA family pseudouridine synthase [Bacillota bacterium LX-D]